MSRRDRHSLNLHESSGVSWFLNQAGRVPLLTHEEELLLGRLVQQWVAIRDTANPTPAQKRAIRAGRRAYERMFNANLRLVVNLAKKYLGAAKNLELIDLIQEGCVGLSRGIEKFDPSAGYKFSTYGYWWIRQGITRALTYQDRVIKLPINAVDALSKVQRWAPVFFYENGRAPTLEECAAYCNTTPPTMQRYLDHMFHAGSLDTINKSTDGATPLLDLVAGEELSPMEELELSDGISKVWELMGSLCEQEARVIALIHDFDGQGPRTHTQAGKALGVSRQQVGEIHKRAMQKMRLQASIGAVA